MTPARLRDLLALADARKARALARLEALTAEDRALEAALRDLGGVHARDMADHAGSGAPLALLGRRLVWADRRGAVLRTERARLASGIADARAEALTCVGKHRALEHMLKDANHAARVAQEARAERDAPPAARSGGSVGSA